MNVNFDWLPPLVTRALDFVLRRQPAPAQPQYIERLKSRKAEVTGHLEQIRAATRFEAPAELAGRTWKNRWRSWRLRLPRRRRAARSLPLRAEKEEESYTERLLKAKKKAHEERE